jgi:hypothetical protein
VRPFECLPTKPENHHLASNLVRFGLNRSNIEKNGSATQLLTLGHQQFAIPKKLVKAPFADFIESGFN